MKHSIYVVIITLIMGMISCSKSSDSADDPAVPSHVGHWIAQDVKVSGGNPEYFTYEKPFELILNSNGVCHVDCGNISYLDYNSYRECNYNVDGSYSFSNNKLTLYVDKEVYTFTFTEYNSSRMVLKSSNFPFSSTGSTFEFTMVRK